MSRAATTQQRLEIRALYSRLAELHNWPMPRSLKADAPILLADADNALICLRHLVAEQCPLPPPPGDHWAFSPESEKRLREGAGP